VLQWLLNDKGFDCGNADGIFGAKTLAAVKTYQKAHGLTADGIVGRNTWKSILA
jgi:g-D-glutamyl-meso-diaminopimelate peptidase